MGLKRYIFKSGLDIIAPLKCGTRWLEGFDVENRIDTFGLHITDLKKHIHSGTTFIWRGVREHFVSAVQTEWAMTPDRDMLDIITQIERGECGHWNPYLYKKLYPIWQKTGFQFYKLRALSGLTPSANEMEYTTSLYAFPKPTKWDNVEEALNSLSPKHIIRINRFIGEEEKWLKLMIEPQYSKKTWEEYSDLEDEVLDIKCKIMDLKEEVELLNKTLVNQLEFQRIKHSELTNSLHNEINELKNLNTKLQTKLDYTEQVMGKPPIKLI